MGILQGLFKKQQPAEQFSGRVYPSEEGKKRGIRSYPTIVFGHHADRCAQRMPRETTMSCIAVTSLDQLERTFKLVPILALRAHSRPEAPGEASEAIRLYKRDFIGVTFYGAWDYNVERAATRALEYEADGIEMPGIRADELYAYVFGVISEAQNHVPRPTTVEEHRKRLMKYTTQASPFWSQQDLIVSKYF
jgi:hypothetical protein